MSQYNFSQPAGVYYAQGSQPSTPSVRDGYHQSTMLMGAETVMPLTKMYLFLNCPGPDSTVRIDRAVKVHRLRIERVWFTLPAGSSAIAPGDSTLYLTFDEVAHSSNATAAQSISSVNAGVVHEYDKPQLVAPALPDNFPGGDPGQAPPYVMSKCVLVFPVFVPTTAIESNTLVVAENKSDVVHDFIGRSNGFHRLRVRLWNRVISTVVGVPDQWVVWNVINTPMQPGSTTIPLPVLNAVRIFIEAHAWVEERQ